MIGAPLLVQFGYSSIPLLCLCDCFVSHFGMASHIMSLSLSQLYLCVLVAVASYFEIAKQVLKDEFSPVDSLRLSIHFATSLHT